MRYTILGFNQVKAYKLGITCKELVFLRWFVDFMATLKMRYIIQEEKTYFWVDYKTVMEELPILRISHKVALRRFLRNLVNKEVLNYHLAGCSMPFYRVNHEKVYSLISSFRRRGIRGGLTQKLRGVNSKVKQSIYKDPNTINSLIDNLANQKSYR